jgi:hypothetical protein
MSDNLTTYDENDRSETLLDRVWDATRPADLSETAFEQIWSQAQELHDDPSILPVHSAGRPGRLWALVPLALAAAAAIFMAVTGVLRPIEPTQPVLVAKPQAQPVLVSTPFDLEPHETLVIEINGNIVLDHRLEPDVKTAVALNDIPANNAADVLNWMEAHSND